MAEMPGGSRNPHHREFGCGDTAGVAEKGIAVPIPGGRFGTAIFKRAGRHSAGRASSAG